MIVGSNNQNFANGSQVVTTFTADSNGATPPVYSNFATAYVITPGWQRTFDENGDTTGWAGPNLPPGYVANDPRWPGATVEAAPPQPQ